MERGTWRTMLVVLAVPVPIGFAIGFGAATYQNVHDLDRRLDVIEAIEADVPASCPDPQQIPLRAAGDGGGVHAGDVVCGHVGER